MLCNSISHLSSTWYLNLIYFTLCFSYGGHLIEIDGINLNKIVGQEAETLIRGPVWIGKNDWINLNEIVDQEAESLIKGPVWIDKL